VGDTLLVKRIRSCWPLQTGRLALFAASSRAATTPGMTLNLPCRAGHDKLPTNFSRRKQSSGLLMALASQRHPRQLAVSKRKTESVF
jgi:hypothetical protein